MIIIILPLDILFNLDITVLPNQLFIQVLTISDSASSGFIGSSIIKVSAPYHVIDQPDHTA